MLKRKWWQITFRQSRTMGIAILTGIILVSGVHTLDMIRDSDKVIKKVTVNHRILSQIQKVRSQYQILSVMLDMLPLAQRESLSKIFFRLKTIQKSLSSLTAYTHPIKPKEIQSLIKKLQKLKTIVKGFHSTYNEDITGASFEELELELYKIKMDTLTTLDQSTGQLIREINDEVKFILTENREHTKIYITLLILVLILAVSIAIFISKSLAHPMDHFKKAIAHFGKGNFDYRLPDLGADEIGRLGSSINQMAEQMVSKQAEIETKHQQLIHSTRLASIGELNAKIAHEIRNPLQVIMGNTSRTKKILVKDHAQVWPQVKEYIEKAQSNCVILNKIMTNILSFAQNKEVELGPIHVNKIINKMHELVAGKYKKNNSQLNINLASSDPIIWGDSHLLLQVMVNLATNSLDAILENSSDEPGHLDVLCQTLNNMVLVTLTDNGCGIDPTIIEKIYDPFFTTKGEQKGTGLGLQISKEIIEKQQGKIICHSKVGEGTSFMISFPLHNHSA